MQQKTIFSQFELFSDESSVKNVLVSNGLIQPSTLNPNRPLIKQYFEACIDNIQKRNSYSLFRGTIIYLIEVQNVYSFFRTITPTARTAFEQYIWKICHIHIAKFELQVQCHKCGDYTSPFIFSCGECLNYSYCSENCHTTHKHQHQSFCIKSHCPTISGGLPLQIHVGSHLQQNIEVKYRNEQRMSYKIKGKKVVSRLNSLIEESPQLQRIKDYKQQNIVIRSIEDVHKAYINNSALVFLRLILLREGCIFKRMENKEEGDNVHLILHYIYPI